MSDTGTETIPRDEALAPPRQARASTRWLKRIVLLLVLLWVASAIASVAIQHTRLRRILTSRLQSSFGRPVEVGSYDFSLLDGFALQANSVTVGEDPRFGQEYFLRADSITVRLRWLSLFRGRIEFSTVSLEKPSLNLVRNAAGEWNLARWLPRPGAPPVGAAFVGPNLPSSSLRFGRVAIDGGRINFKSGDEKLPFAFVNVRGTAETGRPGRWRVNLQATPWRAAVVMQQAGTVRLSGDFGGTSSRLLPAAVDVGWSDASLSDVLRLATGDDAGVRGALALQIHAQTDDAGAWALRTRAQVRQIHRRDLAERPDNPSLALDAQAGWAPPAPFLEITQATFDAPHSHISANGRWYWRREPQQARVQVPPPQVVYSDADLDMADLLAWLRAFHSGVAEDVAVRGFLRVHSALSGWPPRVVAAEVSTPGAELSAPGLRRPARLGELRVRVDRGTATLAPVALSFGPGDDAIHFQSAPPPGRNGLPLAHLTANISDVHDVLTAAEAFGWSLTSGWDISGPARADLRWQGAAYPWKSAPVGSITWGAGPGVATLHAPFLNLPVANINAVSEWRPGSRHIAITSAEAFGARWTGSLDRASTGDDGWHFSLSADHLAAADLDRWMNPARRQGFFGRVLPFLNSRPSPAAPDNLRAGGRLTIEQLTVAPLVVRKLQGNLRIDGRHISFANAGGQFYEGLITGSIDADLQATPSYRADLSFSRVDAAALVAATPALAGVTARSVEGRISIVASGSSRADLISSLACQGNGTAAIFQFTGLPLAKFPFAQGSFSCSRRRIEFQSLSLSSDMNGSGTIDFSRNLDLQFRVQSPSPFRISGTLSSPRIPSVTASRPAR